MKTTLILLALALIFGAGCTNVGSVRYPQPSASFTPKRVYALHLTNGYAKVEKTLDDARIPITNQNKSDTSARIQTDYVEGESGLIALGLVAAQSTRYKYAITLRENDGKTDIGIVCRVESSMNGKNGASPWTDVSSQNAKIVGQLEAWLYEQIEKNL